jgi:carbamoyl-phosphate synthase small subunit
VDVNAFHSATLLLEDGKVFRGRAIGKIGTSTGEICFNTGMTGYQEVFTDPSYFGQIIVMTTDHIGNYGVKESEAESNGIKISGLVCKKFSPIHSRKDSDGSLNDYLIDNHISGISDIDTRALVRYIRNKGAMNCIISSEINEIEELTNLLAQVPSMAGLELSSRVTGSKPYFFGNPSANYKVAVLDYGVKTNILRCLADRDVYLNVFPAHTSYEEMKKWEPDGFMLSNGPGDPMAMDYATNAVKEMLRANDPIFGICLGNQILSRAVGMKTFKMHNGHRGLNHPVINLNNGRSEITTQNHGFAIDSDTLSNDVEITHKNLNDNTVEGIKVKDRNAFAVQYHPEAAPGPHDSRYLFDQFVNNLK